MGRLGSLVYRSLIGCVALVDAKYAFHVFERVIRFHLEGLGRMLNVSWEIMKHEVDTPRARDLPDT